MKHPQKARSALICGGALILAACLAASSGCGSNGPEMKPGEACLKCHGPGGEAEDEPFSFAGTVFRDGSGADGSEGVSISVTDANNKTVTVTSNAVGNFFSEDALAKPLTVTMTKGSKSSTMSTGAASGDCNDCHSAAGEAKKQLASP